MFCDVLIIGNDNLSFLGLMETVFSEQAPADSVFHST